MNPENYFIRSIPFFYDEHRKITMLQYCENCGNDVTLFSNDLRLDLASSLSIDTILRLMKNKTFFDIDIDDEYLCLCWRDEVDDTLKTQIFIDLFIKEIEDLLHDVKIRTCYSTVKTLKTLYKHLKNVLNFSSSISVQINLITVVDQFLKTMDMYNHFISEKLQNSSYNALCTNHVFIPYFFRENYARDVYYAKFFNGLRNVYVDDAASLKRFVAHCKFEIEEVVNIFKYPDSDNIGAEGYYNVYLFKNNLDFIVCIDKQSIGGDYKYVCFPLKSLRSQTTIFVSFDFKDDINNPITSFEFKKYIQLYLSSFVKLVNRYCK